MMDQFRVVYIPGGMTLFYSSWWLYLNDEPIKRLAFVRETPPPPPPRASQSLPPPTLPTPH